MEDQAPAHESKTASRKDHMIQAVMNYDQVPLFREPPVKRTLYKVGDDTAQKANEEHIFCDRPKDSDMNGEDCNVGVVVIRHAAFVGLLVCPCALPPLARKHKILINKEATTKTASGSQRWRE